MEYIVSLLAIAAFVGLFALMAMAQTPLEEEITRQTNLAICEAMLHGDYMPISVYDSNGYLAYEGLAYPSGRVVETYRREYER